MTTLPFTLDDRSRADAVPVHRRAARRPPTTTKTVRSATTWPPAPTKASPCRPLLRRSEPRRLCPGRPRRRAPKELLFIDYWNSVDGLMSSSPTSRCRQGGEMVFKSRDYVVWAPSPGLPRVSLPAPDGRNERFVGLVRGPVASRAGAEQTPDGGHPQGAQQQPRQGPDGARMVLPLTAPASRTRSRRSATMSGSTPTACRRSMPIPHEMAPLANLFTARARHVGVEEAGRDSGSNGDLEPNRALRLPPPRGEGSAA